MIYWAGSDRLGGPRRTRPHTPARPRSTTRPTAGSRLRASADKRVPQDSETDRGGGKDDGVARRRWQLRRGHRCQRVRLTRAHLVVPSISAITIARGNGDGHGGARPWVGRLRRGDGITALVAYTTSISITHRTYSKGKRRKQKARVAQPRASSAGGGHGDPVEPPSR